MTTGSAFPRQNLQAETSRGKDLAALDEKIGELVTSVHLITEAMGAKPKGVAGQSTSYVCASLCPRDFGKAVFDDLPGFRALVNECFSIDAAFHLSVGHTPKPKEEKTLFGRNQKQEATVIVAVVLSKNFNDSAIVIDGDEFLCTMSQVISAREYGSIPVYRPLKLKAPAPAV
jgi:hypothetical protein